MEGVMTRPRHSKAKLSLSIPAPASQRKGHTFFGAGLRVAGAAVQTTFSTTSTNTGHLFNFALGGPAIPT
jgi:hypothetical protein